MPLKAAPVEQTQAGASVEPHSARVVSRRREDAQALAWCSSMAGLLSLTSTVLHTMPGDPLASMDDLFQIAAALLLIGAVVVVWRVPNLIWPWWLWRFTGLAIAALASLIAAQLSYTSDDPAVTWYQTIPLWIGAVGGALLATWHSREPAIPIESTSRRDWIILLGIMALAFLLRFVDLRNIPYVLMGDEAKFAVAARAFNQGLFFRPFTTAVDGHWGLWFMVLGAFTRLLGESVEAIRLHGVIFGTLSILAAYALTCLLWGRRPALIAAALIAAYHFHVHFSRNAMNNIYDALFSMLIFGLFWLGWLKQRRWPWLLGALALGLAQYFYIGGRIILLQVAVLGLFWLITDRARVKTQLLNIALAIGVFAVVALPTFYFAQLRFDDYMTRFNQTNILRNGWLATAMQIQHTGVLPILAQQAVDTIKVFVTGPESLFYQGQSLLTPIMSVLALCSLLYLLRHFKEGRAFWLLTSLGLILIVGGVFTLMPLGGAHHFIGAGPLIYIAIAVFIDRAWVLIEQHWPVHRYLLAAAAVTFIAALMVTDAYYYFGTFVPRHVNYNSADAEPAMQLGEYLHTLEQQPRLPTVICVASFSFSCQHPTVRFLAPELAARAQDVNDLPGDLAEFVPPGDDVLIIIGPDRSADRAAMQVRYPAIIPHDGYGIHGDLMFTAFAIPASPP
jgi:4-amino-4-deoxy-L-arabinose transferase-like glycosyltransferase